MAVYNSSNENRYLKANSSVSVYDVSCFRRVRFLYYSGAAGPSIVLVLVVVLDVWSAVANPRQTGSSSTLMNVHDAGLFPIPPRTARNLTAKLRIEDEDDDEYENDFHAGC